MTTSAAVEKVAGVPVEKDKMEKRRALGRGLESLLPGPRVVAGNSAGGSAGAPINSGGGSGEQQIPRGLAPVRNDNALSDGAAGDVAATAEGAELRSGQAGAAISTFRPPSAVS